MVNYFVILEPKVKLLKNLNYCSSSFLNKYIHIFIFKILTLISHCFIE